ncbi:hypothetical protein LOC68_22135 [Blastopirellula sp. JC732]|uniref:Leucine Rich repeats (2 copies) n=1 Tax=Blastopirellula sediminis TaxID=2894196 RepID=A0A9X1MRM4_9BACT|nr:hypothetical protein [Blastopirellula sediminis]MCC9605600.1 hypothetical protein [Blastopirellula sediminis]MCC9631100.1 hypothetical protein [Blastopirellula sediminis]
MKRFFRFSLFALMVVVTVTAVVLAYVGYYRVRSARFDSLQNELQASGGALTLTSEIGEDPSVRPEPSWADGVFGPNAFAELEEVTLFLNQPAPGLVGRVIGFDSPVCLNAYGKGISDDDAAVIGRSAIEELDLDSTSLTVKGYESIAKASKLHHLTLVGGETKPENLAPLTNCRGLTELTLIDAEMTPELVAAVAKLNSVRDLFLYQVRWPSEEAWQAIGKLSQLESLRITSSKTPAGAAPTLHELPNLKRIAIDFGELASFDGVRVSPELVQELVAIQSLETLDVGLLKCDPPLDAWPSMEALTNLTQLSLLKVRGVADFTTIPTASNLTSLAVGEGFQDATLADLTKLTKLESLTIESDKVTDKVIPSLQGLPKLKYLNLGGSAISDDGIDELAKIKTLREVILGPQITKEGAARLKEALPQCKITLVGTTSNVRTTL